MKVSKITSTHQSPKSDVSEMIATGERASSPDEGMRQKEMIAVATYLRAEQRGFAPENDIDDWFQAEAI